MSGLPPLTLERLAAIRQHVEVKILPTADEVQGILRAGWSKSDRLEMRDEILELLAEVDRLRADVQRLTESGAILSDANDSLEAEVGRLARLGDDLADAVTPVFPSQTGGQGTIRWVKVYDALAAWREAQAK